MYFLVVERLLLYYRTLRSVSVHFHQNSDQTPWFAVRVSWIYSAWLIFEKLSRWDTLRQAFCLCTFLNTSKSSGIQKPEFSENYLSFLRGLCSQVSRKSWILGLFWPEFFENWRKPEFFRTWVFFENEQKKKACLRFRIQHHSQINEHGDFFSKK